MTDTDLREKLWPAAQEAGVVDRDALKLLDVSTLQLDPKGELILPRGFFDRARAAKPHIFDARRMSAAAYARARGTIR